MCCVGGTQYSNRMTPSSDYRDITRPRANSWLDKSAKRIGEVLAEKYQIATFDPDQGYLRYAEELRGRLSAMSLQLGISVQAAQRYFDEATFTAIADGIAGTMSAEHPGENPFADPETVYVLVDLWLRGIWGLQLAAAATRPENETYAWVNVEVATQMTSALVKTIADTVTGYVVVPRSAAVYVARTMQQTAEQVRIWDCPLGDLTAERLADELSADARKLRAQIDRH